MSFYSIHPRYLAEPKQPIREVLRALTGSIPPAFVRGYNTGNLSDEQNEELQDWAGLHAKPNWLTGLGVIEAAEFLVREAVANGNIPPPPEQA